MTVRATWGLTRQALTKSSPLWRDFRWPERQSPLAVSSTPSATGPAPTTRPTEARRPLAHQDHDQASAAELRPVLAEGNVHQQWQPDPDVVRMRSVRCGTVQGQGVFWRLPPAPGLVGSWKFKGIVCVRWTMLMFFLSSSNRAEHRFS